MKFQFVDLTGDVKAIIGKNGIIWIYYSTIKVETEYFTDDQTKLKYANQIEVKEILIIYRLRLK